MNGNNKPNHILEADIVSLASSNLPIEQFVNKTIFITGATGLLGSQLAKTLLKINEMNDANIKVIALGRSEERLLDTFDGYLDNPNLLLMEGDVRHLAHINETIDYIIHGASVTSSKDFVDKPVDTIATAVFGSHKLLELAREKQVKGFLYLSSLEVYGELSKPEGTVEEWEYGYLDPMKVRSSYSEGKRMVECLCTAYFHQYGVPIRIARLTQTFGAGVSYDDNRVFAQFARSIIEGKDIVLHTLGETVRNYCYTTDAIAAMIYILAKGANGEVYNVANESTDISIAEMAEQLTLQYQESGSKVVYSLKDNEATGYNPTICIRLDTKKLRSLGWGAKVALFEMYDRLIESMKETMEE